MSTFNEISSGDIQKAALSILRDGVQSLTSMPNEAGCLNYVLDRMRLYLNADYGAVMLYRGKVISVAATHGNNDGKMSPMTQVVGPVERVMKDGATDIFTIIDVNDHPNIPKTPEGKPVTSNILKSCIIAPLYVHGAPLGAIVLGFKDVKSLEQVEEDFFALMANQLATRLRESRMQGIIEQFTSRLAAHGETITPDEQEIDKITNLPVRSYFVAELERVTHDTVNIGGQLSILLVAVDGIREAADAYGYGVVESALRRMAEILSRSIRGRDLPSAYDEGIFAIMLPNTPALGAVVVAERLREKVTGVIDTGSDEIWNLTAGIGIASLSSTVTSHEQLTMKAERCLKQAQSLGASQVFLDWEEAVEGMSEE
ncbi:MAG: sensor domain-containing diguanylate cyclase [bacterium]